MFDEHAIQADSHKAAMSAATEQHAAEKAEAQAAHDTALAAAKAEAETLSGRLAEAVERSEAAGAEIAQLQKSLANERREREVMSDKIGTVEADRQKVAQEQEIALSALETEHAQALEQVRATLAAAHATADTAKGRHEAEVAELQAAHDAAVKAAITRAEKEAETWKQRTQEEVCTPVRV
eukprot:COSAG01_NODE_13390_length_1591_cov_49.707301_1_plen_181_part_00